MTQPSYLGVDLGGTQLRMAVVDGSGALTSEVVSVATGRDFRPLDFTSEIGRLWRTLQTSSTGLEIAALGVGTPGVIVNQTITESDNLPLLNGADLRALASRAVDFPVNVENDARCFALAEARYGAGQGAGSICGLTLGTGVGCGVIIGGNIHRGANSAAG
ncbi:MAG: ROK family protein, partial [Acidobacteriota bacterium]